MYRVVYIYLHAFLKPIIYIVGDWSVSRPGCFNTCYYAHGKHGIEGQLVPLPGIELFLCIPGRPARCTKTGP
jgi:hypothetical protein